MIFSTKGIEKHPSNGKVMGIPNPSWVTIAALPEHRVVLQEKVTGGIVSTDLPIGKYAMSVVGLFKGRRAQKQVRCHYVLEFLHGCTEEQWENLQDLTPRMTECVITSTGTVWTCRFCQKQSKARLEAAMHECVHYGIDPLDVNADHRMQDVTPSVPKGFIPVPTPSMNPLRDEPVIPAPSALPVTVEGLEELP